MKKLEGMVLWKPLTIMKAPSEKIKLHLRFNSESLSLKFGEFLFRFCLTQDLTRLRICSQTPGFKQSSQLSLAHPGSWKCVSVPGRQVYKNTEYPASEKVNLRISGIQRLSVI